MLNLSTSQRKFWVMTTVICSLAMVFFDASALPIALPSIQRQLHISENALQWIINAYLLSLGVLILLGGKFSDKFGARRIFLLGLIVFTLSSLCCALAPNEAWLIASRVLQGVGGALMIPSTSPLFRSIILPHEFGKMTGINLSISSLFLMLGPTLGGVLVQYLSWRWIFWINLPTALLACCLTLLAVPSNQPKTQAEKFDWLGFLTSSLSLVCLVFALMQGASWGWLHPIILGCFSLSLLSALIFLWVELHIRHPYLHLELFRLKYFSNSVFILFIMQSVFITAVFFALFLQYTWHFSPARAGVILLALQTPVVIFSSSAGYLLDRYGPRLPASIGTFSAIAACLWIALSATQSKIGWLLPGFILFGCSIPFTNLPLVSTTISSATPERRGIASAITHTARQIGSSLGLAVFSTLILQLSQHRFIQGLSLVHKNTVPSFSLDKLLSNPKIVSEQLHQAAIAAYDYGFSFAMFAAAAMSLLAFWISLRLPKRNIFISKPADSLAPEKSNETCKSA